MNSLLLRLAAGSLRLWILAGLLLRITRLRDWFHPLAVVYYTTPWPAMAAGLLLLAVHAWRLGRGHALRRYLILTGGALFIWVALSWKSHPDSPRRPDLRVTLYNVARPESRLPHLAAFLRAQDADVIALAESVPEKRPALDRWQKEFPGYVLVPLPGEMLCLVRGELLSAETGDLAFGSPYGLLHLRVRGAELTLLQVDLDARPLGDRAPALRQLTALAEAHAGERLLVLGDFNTPRDSHFLNPLRGHFTHAFEASGHGFAETWPMPFPVLSLDQIWSSPRLEPLRCRIGYQFWSDHRPVTAEFAFR